MKRFLLIFFLSYAISTTGQTVSAWDTLPTIQLSGVADIFYVYDFQRPQDLKRQSFLFNHNRHNEFNLNHGFVKWEIAHTKYRSHFALHTGTYVQDNYASEPGVLQNILEANIGLSLNRSNSLWLDAGVLPSHIGFESAISMENPTLTRSILAENSPYFMAGAKLTYAPNPLWEFSYVLMNGWQRIQRLQGNSLPSMGSQLRYRAHGDMVFNWSTFVGTQYPDSTRRLRYFNNFYGDIRLSNRFSCIVGFDIGLQQSDVGSTTYDVWMSPVLISRYKWNLKWSTAVRAEYYQDDTGVMIPTDAVYDFRTSGISMNMDFTPTSYILCRMEGRWLYSQDPIFQHYNFVSHHNFVIAASIAVRFNSMISRK